MNARVTNVIYVGFSPSSSISDHAHLKVEMELNSAKRLFRHFQSTFFPFSSAWLISNSSLAQMQAVA